MNESDILKFWAESEPCADHGIQKEPGFSIDEVTGELRVMVILCHTDAKSEPKKRLVMIVPNDDATQAKRYRVHDHVTINRRRGKQCVHDWWTLGQTKLQQFLRWCSEQIEEHTPELLDRLGDALKKRLPL